MKKSLSLKLNWKRVSLGTLAGLFVLLLGCLVSYYFVFYLPKQEMLRAAAKTDSRLLEIEKQIYEAKSLPFQGLNNLLL